MCDETGRNSNYILAYKEKSVTSGVRGQLFVLPSFFFFTNLPGTGVVASPRLAWYPYQKILTGSKLNIIIAYLIPLAIFKLDYNRCDIILALILAGKWSAQHIVVNNSNQWNKARYPVLCRYNLIIGLPRRESPWIVRLLTVAAAFGLVKCIFLSAIQWIKDCDELTSK